MTVTNPFDLIPGKLEFMGIAQKEALSRMMYAVQTKTLGVLTGEVGSGKSSLLGTLTQNLAASDYQLVCLSSSDLHVKDLYGGVLKAVGESPSFSLSKIKQQWRELQESRFGEQSRQLVVLIDEAHELSDNTLLEIRFFMSRGLDPTPHFPVILAGQSKLRRDLNRNRLEPIAQRVRMQYHLAGMSPDECSAYIEYRMNLASLDRPVFTDGAKKLIHATSKGLPRVVNLLAGPALYQAEQKNDNAVEEKHVHSVIADWEKQRGH